MSYYAPGHEPTTRISKCDRTDSCPEILDHDERCLKFDKEFWANVVKMERKFEQTEWFPLDGQSDL